MPRTFRYAKKREPSPDPDCPGGLLRCDLARCRRLAGRQPACRGADPAFDRLLGLVGQIGKVVGQNDLGSVTDVAGRILKGTLG